MPVKHSYSIGQTITQRDGNDELHLYTLVGSALSRRRGRYRLLWLGNCAVCSDPFEIITPIQVSKALTRNCELHRSAAR